jgi:hypothetical protein
MGLKPFPYQTGQAMLFPEDVIWSLRDDPKNIFHWSHIEMNLPGSLRYDPT